MNTTNNIYYFRPQDYIIADFGCGEAILADSIFQTVHSFDLIAINSKVTACDISHTPLLMGSVNVVVFCLSLMGTNIKDYLLEANRVLKMKYKFNTLIKNLIIYFINLNNFF